MRKIENTQINKKNIKVDMTPSKEGIFKIIT